MAYTDKNLYAYCDNNPVMRVDNGGEFWDVVLDVISLCASVADVVTNPDDPWAWVGLGADVVSLVVPFATGGGLLVDVLTKTDDVVDLAKTIDNTVDAADAVYDGTKVMSKAKVPDCFVAGTMIATENGHLPIETISVGAHVWATDPETGKTELKQVENTFVNETTCVTHITVKGETITSTQTHPYYVANQGWVLAKDLRAGDILVILNGEQVVLELVQHEILESPVATYNFEVEDFHTYYVGNNGILVHNKCIIKQAKLPTKGKIRYIPPENYGKQLPRTSNGGYIDRFDNVWQKGPSRTMGEAFEWDVQLSPRGKAMLGWLSPDGRHLNVSLKGRITH